MFDVSRDDCNTPRTFGTLFQSHFKSYVEELNNNTTYLYVQFLFLFCFQRKVQMILKQSIYVFKINQKVSIQFILAKSFKNRIQFDLLYQEVGRSRSCKISSGSGRFMQQYCDWFQRYHAEDIQSFHQQLFCSSIRLVTNYSI